MFTGVRTYFQDIAVGLGYKKHYDGFNIENIPGSKFDKAFHVEAFNFTAEAQSQLDLRVACDVSVRLFFKSFAKVDDGISKATTAAEEYVGQALVASKRLTNTNLKNVILNQVVIEPYAVSNDNYVVCRMVFSATLFKEIEP